MSDDHRDPLIAVSDEETRALGNAPTGEVGLRNFDEAVVRGLGAVIWEESGKGPLANYYIPAEKLAPVEPPDGAPGIPVTFSHPEDIWERYRQPVIVVRRDGIDPAMNRWHPGGIQWRAPAQTARPVSVTLNPGTVSETTLEGFDAYEQMPSVVPFDITYTLSALTRHRGKGPRPPRDDPTGFTGSRGSPRNQVNRIFDYILRRYAPYSMVLVTDSVGDERSYSAFMEAISHLDEVPEVTERVLGFALTLRVEAVLDLNDPIVSRAVGAPLTLRSEVL